MNFFRISRQIPENSDVCRFFNQICENKSEICRKFWILWKLFTIFQNCSLHSLPGRGSGPPASRPSAARAAAPAGAHRAAARARTCEISPVWHMLPNRLKRLRNLVSFSAESAPPPSFKNTRVPASSRETTRQVVCSLQLSVQISKF